MLITGDIKIENGNANTKVAFKNCAPFARCVTPINDEHVETAENLDIIMPMYNLTVPITQITMDLCISLKEMNKT